jgi:hypothetical protein
MCTKVVACIIRWPCEIIPTRHCSKDERGIVVWSLCSVDYESERFPGLGLDLSDQKIFFSFEEFLECLGFVLFFDGFFVSFSVLVSCSCPSTKSMTCFVGLDDLVGGVCLAFGGCLRATVGLLYELDGLPCCFFVDRDLCLVDVDGGGEGLISMGSVVFFRIDLRGFGAGVSIVCLFGADADGGPFNKFFAVLAAVLVLNCSSRVRRFVCVRICLEHSSEIRSRIVLASVAGSDASILAVWSVRSWV